MASPTNEAAGSSSSPIPPSSTDHQHHYTYQVFLSFRGEDTRYNFTDHLYTALCQRGIETFRDDDELRKGEEISPALLRAIEESKVSIIVFSQNYASSRWCLDELDKIMECRQSRGQEVRAVFYKVEPSDVRGQRGSFGDAFANLDQGRHKDSMGKWREALTEAANLSGWTFKDGEYEGKFIKDIVEELCAQVLNPSCLLEVAAHPIGLETCTQEVNELLRVEENTVRMIGIWGPGGIGKTTIAKDVFNSISHRFDSSCFLADVRSKSSSSSDGLTQLQKSLLDDILRDSTLKVGSVDQGVSFIKTRMRRKKVLLVLDDVSDSRQLQKLAPSSDCFGPGSRILITTRDNHLLTAHGVDGVDEVYVVKMLDYDQAMKLFSLSAFKRNEPLENYLELAHRAVRYAKGLPLALTVLGSHLYCRSIDQWEDTLDSCERGDTHSEISNILKLSYDALGADLKGFFLDIACFFKGKHVDDVKPILEACYDLKSATHGIAQLQQKALIKLEREMFPGMEQDKIWMHDLIEEMGKKIVYQESPDEPGERSRLWCEDDIDHVLTNNTGTNNIKGIQFAFRSAKHWNDAKSFSVMKKLRYLSIRGLDCGESEIDYHFEELRCLDLPRCLLHSFPSGFHANKLVRLYLSGASSPFHNLHSLHVRDITRLWGGGQKMSRLTSMSLSWCHSLTELPDFSGIPNLKELDLSYCPSLIEIPDSVGLLDKLVTLSVNDCRELIRFPRKINLKFVETIDITCCGKLEEFSEVGEDMCSLKSLDLTYSGIKELHPSIGKLLIGLEELTLYNCDNLTSLPDIELGNLKSLNLYDDFPCTGSRLEMSPKFPVQMNSLSFLCLGHSDIRELDESIGNLIGLQELDLSSSENLTSLPCSIYGLQHLKKLHLSYCPKLVRFPTNTNIQLSLPRLQVLRLRECSSLSDCDFLTTLDCCQTLEEVDLSSTNLVSLPACFTKFVNLRKLYLWDCRRLRERPELPLNYKSLCFFGFEKEASSIEEEASIEEELPTPFLWLCSSSESPKRHRIEDEPSKASPAELSSMLSLSCVIPPKRQRIAGEASVVHSTTPLLQHQVEDQWLSLSLSDSNQH